MTAPAANAALTGTATLSATASENAGVAGVQFTRDGANLGPEAVASAYTLSWETRTASNGSHTLTAVARDAAGNVTTSAGVTVTVSNLASPPPAGTLLFQEGFEDANLSARGWYDNTTPLLSTAEHVASSASSIQYTFNQAATTPTAGSAGRHKFTPSDSVYLGYWG